MAPPDTYTVAEIAERLKPDAADREQYRVLRWIQNSTTAGLLRPVDGRHGGRGVHRRYADNEVYKAAVLLALAELQLPGGQLEMVADWIDDVSADENPAFLRKTVGRRRHPPRTKARLAAQRRLWEGAKTGGGSYLAMTLLEGGGFNLGLNAQPEVRNDDRLTIVINLTRLFAEMR